MRSLKVMTLLSVLAARASTRGATAAIAIFAAIATVSAPAQTITEIQYAKVLRDPGNQLAHDLVLVLGVRNDKHAPINVDREQFTLLDGKGDIYQTSNLPVPGGALPASIGVGSPLPQRVNPKVTISPVLLFVVPSELMLTDARVCLQDSCQPLGSAVGESEMKELQLYRNHVAGLLFKNWVEPYDLPPGITTFMTVLIGTDGNISNLAVTKSSGERGLDDSCLNSVRQVSTVDPPPTPATVPLYFHCSVGQSHPFPFGVDAGVPESSPSNQADGIDGIPIEKIGADVTPPKLVYAADPKIPDSFRRKKEAEALVVVALIVDTEGLPQKISIARSFSPELDQSAIEAVSTYRFKPARKNGIPVPVRVNIEVTFKNYEGPLPH
jgi:TonB family protein